LDGTVAAFREEIMKKTEMRITETNARRIGFVNQEIFSKIGGRTKSLALGGVNPSPSAARLTNVRTHTP
jgi:hypothetical protein